MDEKEAVRIAREQAKETLLGLFRSCGLDETEEWKIDLFLERIIAVAMIEMAIAQRDAIEKVSLKR